MGEQHWWYRYPWRMVQTNLREIDMADIDAEQFAQELADFGATVVTLNAGGILASYPSRLPYHTVSKYLTGSSLKEILTPATGGISASLHEWIFPRFPTRFTGSIPIGRFRRRMGTLLSRTALSRPVRMASISRKWRRRS